eukprot:6404203-Prymnesium_polylepis.1
MESLGSSTWRGAVASRRSRLAGARRAASASTRGLRARGSRRDRGDRRWRGAVRGGGDGRRRD